MCVQVFIEFLVYVHCDLFTNDKTEGQARVKAIINNVYEANYTYDVINNVTEANYIYDVINNVSEANYTYDVINNASETNYIYDVTVRCHIHQRGYNM